MFGFNRSFRSDINGVPQSREILRAGLDSLRIVEDLKEKRYICTKCEVNLCWGNTVSLEFWGYAPRVPNRMVGFKIGRKYGLQMWEEDL